MTSNEDIVEMTIGKGGQYETRLDIDEYTSFVIKDITNVRVFIPKEQRWIDIGYKGPVTITTESGETIEDISSRNEKL